MKKKCLFLIIYLLPIFGLIKAQTPYNFPDGLHLGVTGQMNLAQKMCIVQTTSDVDMLNAHAATGWNAGLELSYHFCQHFAFSISAIYGTTIQFKYDCLTPYELYTGEANRYDISYKKRISHLQVPVKFEIHAPISKNFSFYGTMGVNLKNIYQSIGYAIHKNNHSNSFLLANYNPVRVQTAQYQNNPFFFEAMQYDENGVKVQADVQFSVGVYYQLPFNGLIKFGVTGNYAPNATLKGSYSSLMDASGTMSYHHNYIGFELGYIHCFQARR